MFNKKSIEDRLTKEGAVAFISRLRTQFSPIMTELYFFRIFFETLYRMGINGTTSKKDEPFDGGIKTDCYIILYDKNKDCLKNKYDPYKLNKDLYEYNQSLKQEDMSMKESAHALINIFLSILE